MSGFKEDLMALINKHSMENESNTPDFILAQHLMMCLSSFEMSVNRRDEWYGVDHSFEIDNE